MNRVPDLLTEELSGPATDGLVRPQNEQAPKPSSDSGSLREENPQAQRLQADALEPRLDASAAPANNGAVRALGKAEVAAPVPALSGLEPAAPAFTPASPNLGAIPVASQAIGPDGAPIATAPSTPASPDSAPPLAEAPKTAAPLAAPQTVKPGGAPIATAPPIPALTDSAPPAEAPKPNATPAAHVSDESVRRAPPKIDSPKRPSRKASLKRPAKSAKVSGKPVARLERQSTVSAPPKEAESSPQPAQGTDNPTAVAPTTPTIQQRFADGITHAFSYVTHLPGALVSHPADPNAGAH